MIVRLLLYALFIIFVNICGVNHRIYHISGTLYDMCLEFSLPKSGTIGIFVPVDLNVYGGAEQYRTHNVSIVHIVSQKEYLQP